MIKKDLISKTNQKSFVLVELLIVLGILIILMAIAVPDFRTFQNNSNVSNKIEEIANSLRLAQSKTIASQESYQYGVYFDTSTVPNRYILFRGESFASKDPSFEKDYNLPEQIEISNVNLWGGREVVFERLTGYASSAASYGEVSLSLISNPSETKSVYVENSGLVSFAIPQTISNDGRITDSRHMHFEYGRDISTSTEKIFLDFSGTIQEIIIADNLKEGQIYWEGEVVVGSVSQKIKIHTHRINNSGTQFCVHRDGRYNDKAMSVYIDGDVTGSLIDYTALGQEFRGSSINLVFGAAGDPERQ
jgi:type II secretory pathway pseudopilin PulG